VAEERPRRLLNPFVFPSETQLRFSLLVWAILSLCWGVGYIFTTALASSAGWPVLKDLPKLETDVLGVQAHDPNLSPASVLEQEALLAERLAGLSEPEARDRIDGALVRLSQAAHHQWLATLPYLGLPFAFLLLAVLSIAVLYFVRARRPWFARRSQSHHPGSPEFQAAMDGLVEDAQILQRELHDQPLARPVFQMSRGAIGDGQTYGTSRRPRIVLTRAVALLLKKEIRQHGKPTSIRALVFHELAHIANRDIVRASLAEVSWVVLVPVLASLLAAFWLTWSSEGITDSRHHPVVMSLQVLGTLLVVELIRRGLLRSREYFADSRVGMLWKAGDPLRAALQREGDRPSLRREHFLRPWIGFWRKHPAPEERREVLDNPSLLFAIHKDAAFLAGLLFGSLLAGALLLVSTLVISVDGLAAQAVADLARKYCDEKGPVYAMQFYYRIGLFGSSLSSFASTYVLPVMTIYLLAGTLGVQVQRESVRQMMESHLHSHPYRALWMSASLAALGFEVGLLLAPLGLAMPGSAGAALGAFLWVGYATLLLWLWLATIRFFARHILGRHIAARSPSRRLILGMILASAILLLPLVVALIGAQLWIWPGVQSARGGLAVVSGAVGLLLFAFFLMLMLFTFAIWQAGRQGARKPRCPNCHEDPGGTTVADCCTVCGNSLAPWLLILDHKDTEGAPE
jgi:Zn-dependent protease with chaperone function